uniref:Uncharacterized protein n=1 Tax=Cuerna arida TaxID=1464854 RepID=A0A1B6F7J3_9HEMI
MKEKVQRQQGVEEIDITTTTVCKESRKLHDTINLPKNLCYSDDSADEECSSEEDNDEFSQDTSSLHRPVSDLATNELSRQFQDITFHEGRSLHVDEEALKKFSLLPVNEKYDKVLEIILELCDKSSSTADSTNKDLKARSPFRNRVALQTLHKQTPFDRPDLTVTSLLGNGGNVYVQNIVVDNQPSIIPKTVSSFPSDTLLQDDELRKLLENQIFYQEFLGMVEEMFKNVEDVPEVPSDSLDQSLISPMMTSPVTSPSTELYDSSYETGSPGSTVGTSPAPRTSVSSDSDVELDSGMETRSNIVIIPAPTNNRLEHSIPIKVEPDVKPLGEVVHFVKMSATQRLDELSKSTSFCEKHYAIQLVKVVLISNAKTIDDRLNNFSKSLLETMKVKPNKANDSDIWQLSLFAHIEFLTAKDRMREYRSTLLSRDEQLHSLLYIAAVERYDKPMIARYVAESLAKVNYNPLEVYDNGNTILHVLAELGDSHKDVLSELLMASGADGKPLMDVAATNKKGQSALHTAVLSPHQHLSTVLLLLKMKANPFQEDMYKKTPLYYQMMGAAKQEPRNGRDLEVIRKMIQAHPLRTKEALEMLEDMCGNSYFPSDLRATIQAEITYWVKEVKTRKLERR